MNKKFEGEKKIKVKIEKICSFLIIKKTKVKTTTNILLNIHLAM